MIGNNRYLCISNNNLKPYSYEVHPVHRIRGDVRLRQGSHRRQDHGAQVHPQQGLRRRHTHRSPGRSQVRIQAALPGLEVPHQRADPRMEQPRPLPGRPLRPRHLLQDHRQQPLHEAQLLDSLLRRRRPDGPAHAPRGEPPSPSQRMRSPSPSTPSPRRTWPT